MKTDCIFRFFACQRVSAAQNGSGLKSERGMARVYRNMSVFVNNKNGKFQKDFLFNLPKQKSLSLSSGERLFCALTALKNAVNSRRALCCNFAGHGSREEKGSVFSRPAPLSIHFRPARWSSARLLRGISSCRRYAMSAPRKESEMETIFHVLGIVYYTVALIALLAEIREKQRDKHNRQ